jgi:hypothetical protein
VLRHIGVNVRLAISCDDILMDEGAGTLAVQGQGEAFAIRGCQGPTRHGGWYCDRERGARKWLQARSNRTSQCSPVLAHLVHPATVSLTTLTERSATWNRNNAST